MLTAKKPAARTAIKAAPESPDALPITTSVTSCGATRVSSSTARKQGHKRSALVVSASPPRPALPKGVRQPLTMTGSESAGARAPTGCMCAGAK